MQKHKFAETPAGELRACPAEYMTVRNLPIDRVNDKW